MPGSPKYQGSINEIYERSLTEAVILEQAGMDGVIVENFGDEPFLIEELDLLNYSLFTSILRDIRHEIKIPLGVNIQFNAWKAELTIAHVCQADFIRVEVFVDTVVSPFGLVLPCAAKLLRYRAEIGSTVQILADVQTKYTKNLVSQSIWQSATDAKNANADGVIVTGSATGQSTSLDQIKEAKKAVDIPVFIGSGANIHNIRAALEIADGVIVGSSLKEMGIVTNMVSLKCAKEFVAVAKGY